MTDRLVMAVDVGTASARAGVLDAGGGIQGYATSPIPMRRQEPDIAELDSEAIWRAVCRAARAARSKAGVHADRIDGIAFDATCSLVVRDEAGGQIGVGESRDCTFDTIAWLDHRAHQEALECTASGHPVLRYQGGAMSPEMQIPKLMWLKRHLPERWAEIGFLFDLTDFLSWKASGSLERSHCTLTSKWTYLGHERPGWQADFLERVGLDDLLERGGLPMMTSPIGHDLDPLTADAADELGLTRSCRVATGLIDAHAGVLGLLGDRLAEHGSAIDGHAALVAGTSSSVMVLSHDARMAKGAWGPYFSVALPDHWLIDAGQSATGALLDHLIRHHGAGGEPTPARHAQVIAGIERLRAVEGEGFADHLHVLPDFHGNRSPLADARAVGVISGLDLDASFDNLCRLYWRTALGLALGVRQILENLDAAGYRIETLHVTGGHTRNPVLMELYRDTLGCRLIEREPDFGVLRGTAAAAASAAGLHRSLAQAAAAMSVQGRERVTDPMPNDRYARDYQVFRTMQAQRQELDRLGTT